MAKEKKIQLKTPHAEIGVFGGSGFYDLLENAQEYVMDTPFGKPSDSIFIGKVEGRQVAFIPRHARGINFHHIKLIIKRICG